MNVIITMVGAVKRVKMKLVATNVYVGLATNLIQIFRTAQVYIIFIMCIQWNLDCWTQIKTEFSIIRTPQACNFGCEYYYNLFTRWHAKSVYFNSTDC